jgi:two-component system alkaline phosphatase synthesis response regulator PhoP
MSTDYTIYSIEDDPEIADIICLALRGQGFDVVNFGTGEDFLKAMDSKKPNMILLDMMLPGIQGRDLLKILRSNPQYQNIVIIIVSAKSLVSDKIDGLNLGADDYIAKPFDINEFISRINAHYRRHIQAERSNSTTLSIGDYVIDLDNKTIKKGGVLINVTKSEYDISELLFLHRGTTVSKLEISEKLYGPVSDPDKLKKQFRTIDMHVKDLRQKLGDSQKSFILTVFGNGYTIA